MPRWRIPILCRYCAPCRLAKSRFLIWWKLFDSARQRSRRILERCVSSDWWRRGATGRPFFAARQGPRFAPCWKPWTGSIARPAAEGSSSPSKGCGLPRYLQAQDRLKRTDRPRASWQCDTVPAGACRLGRAIAIAVTTRALPFRQGARSRSCECCNGGPFRSELHREGRNGLSV